MKISERVQAILATDLASVRSIGGTVALGVRTSGGREVAVRVDALLAEDMVRLSDGGDAWSDLILGGYVDPQPTATEREKLEALCALHRVSWEPTKREVFAIVPVVDAPSAVRRMTAVATAIDGWRAWYPSAQETLPSPMSIVRGVQQLAPKRGWKVEPGVEIAGKLHPWRADARLSRKRDGAAVLFMFRESAEYVVQRAIGWHYDVQQPLVLVLPPSMVKSVEGAKGLPSEIGAVPRLAKGTAERIVDRVERFKKTG